MQTLNESDCRAWYFGVSGRPLAMPEYEAPCRFSARMEGFCQLVLDARFIWLS